MSGLSLYPRPAPAVAPALSPDLLAVIVAIVAFLVSGGFLLSLTPARSLPPGAAADETATPAPASAQSNIVVKGAGPLSPLGGAGGPPRRPASHIPVERNGLTSYLPSASIVAVRADAHYTHIFDGTTSHFCLLPIGELESRLDPLIFARVHRSHIVNIARVDGARFNGDSGMIELAAEQRYSVPVSRARIGQVKARLAGLQRAAE
jgi:DNA-binding LytR/AlgR family response regulator